MSFRAGTTVLRSPAEASVCAFDRSSRVTRFRVSTTRRSGPIRRPFALAWQDDHGPEAFYEAG